MYSLDNDVRKSLAESAVYCAAVIDKTRTMIGFTAGQKTAPVAFMQAVAASIANGDMGFRDEQAADRFFNTNKFLRAFSKSHTFEERLALAGLKPPSWPDTPEAA
ncbi:MAG: hypothetical protein KGL39_12825 [Patescibacteria group bacterium]|nr:hypothetical protein [Patescibacteria group bacterium]